MNEQKAREILGQKVQPDNRLEGCVPWVWWNGTSEVGLDGNFSSQELLAIAWWVENMKVVRES